MSAEAKTEGELEIAHVLFMDAVGFSKLPLDEQRGLIGTLTRIVRETATFRAAEQARTLIRLPTGDGMALIFSESLEAPARCALEIAQKLKAEPALQLRMGIHSGPVSRVQDVNEQANAAGAGINIAQRVMSCGDAGHILVSRRTSEDLAEHRFWRPMLHDIGESEVKHGVKVGLVNLFNDEIGNRALPEKCRRKRANSRALWITGVAAVILLLGGIGLLWRLRSAPPSERSIAVLPFDDSEANEQMANLASGLHDEILTDLSRVANLKVVSRTSVMQYKGVERNLREIAKQLGVATILEGAVRFSGNQVRVNAQLIDARHDAHIWAQTYDRDVADIFALESEVAEKIVEQLAAKLSPKEKAAIEERPTSNLAAYQFYIRGKNLVEGAVFSPGKEDLLEAVSLLNQATGLDQNFASAYYQLAHAHDQIYLRGFDHTAARLNLADDAIRALQKLRPDSGEAHLALAKHLYWGYLDYDHARQELLLARLGLPNEPLSYLLLGYIDRRQGRWNESIANMEQALELDPHNAQTMLVLDQLAKTYICLRDYAKARGTLERALEIAPADQSVRMEMAMLQVDQNADFRGLKQTLATVISEKPEAAEAFAEQSMLIGIYEKDVHQAQAGLASLPPAGCHDQAVPFPHEWCAAKVERLRGDRTTAASFYSAGRKQLESSLRQRGDDGPLLCAAAVLDAALGQKEKAIAEGTRAVSLLPLERDSINGALLRQYLAAIYGLSGETDKGLQELEAASKVPGYLSYGQLMLDPIWESLRADPRFAQVAAQFRKK